MKKFGGDVLKIFVENIGGKYLMERFWWKMFGIKFSGKFSTKMLVYIFRWKLLVENLWRQIWEENAIFGILEPHALKKRIYLVSRYIQWR